MLQKIPGAANDPLFTVPRHGQYLPLTDTIVRKHLKRVLKALGWEQQKYTFHTFRRSRASWAHNHGVPIQAIKDQGTWSSDCVYRYISSDTQFSSSPFSTCFPTAPTSLMGVWVNLSHINFLNNSFLCFWQKLSKKIGVSPLTALQCS